MSVSLPDFTQMPPPNAVELLDFETILAAIKADLITRDPNLTLIYLESEPITKILEAIAYRELIYRQRVNDAVQARMLPFAAGLDLDYLGIDHGVTRFIITPGDAAAVPPVAPVLESDASLRVRIVLAISAKTTAGAVNGYKFHALTADADARDISVVSLAAGIVTITVLSNTGNGLPGATLLGAITSALTADHVRPLTDQVNVQAATIIPLTITAEVTVYPNLSTIDVQTRALAAVVSFLDMHHKLGHDITLAGLIAALTVTGVQNVSISSPVADVVVDDFSAAYCAAPSITVAALAAL